MQQVHQLSHIALHDQVRCEQDKRRCLRGALIVLAVVVVLLMVVLLLLLLRLTSRLNTIRS